MTSACSSIIIAVTTTVIAISIQKPDTGNIVAVRPDVTLVKGLAPVMNIVLAFSMLSPVSVLAATHTDLA